MSLVSVIVPCYNVSSFIGNLSSVFEQSYKELELILVDDCSSDDTWQKLQEFKQAHSDKRIIVHHNEQNLGVGLTRNKGFALSSGEFVVFWDADDQIEPDYIEKMLSQLNQKQADFVCCAYYFHEGAQVSVVPVEHELLESKTTLEIKHHFFNFMCAVWNKLVRRSFIEQYNISFPDSAYGEERVWTMQLVLNANNIAFVEEPLYHYFRFPNSMTSWSNIRVLDGISYLLQFSEQLFHQKGMFDDLVDEWKLRCLYDATKWWFKFPNGSDLQCQFALRFYDFCQKQNIELVWQKYPFYVRAPLYRLLSKKLNLKLRWKLKCSYNCCKALRNYNDIFGAILDIAQKRSKQQ